MKRKKQQDDLSSVRVRSGDRTQASIQNEGIWERFFRTLRYARIPVKALLLYIFAYIVQSVVLVKLPQVDANFFAGDASVGSVSLFIGVELVSTVISLIVLYINYYLRARINCNLRNALWEKILKLRPAYFDRVSSTTLLSRITVDTESVNNFFMDIFLELIFQIYMLILTIREMSAISIQAGLILLAFIPLSFVYSFLMGRVSLKVNNSLKFKLSDLTAYLSDLMSCLPLLKAFNRQGYERRRGRKVIDDYCAANEKLILLEYLKAVLGSFVGIGPEICIILFGVQMLNDGTVDAAGWYTFYVYAGTFIGFVNTLGTMWQSSKTVQGTLNKVSDVLDEQEESLEGYVQDIVESGDIQFDHVSFGYEGTPVLRDVSFTIPGKRNTVIVGVSGAGKSTLLRLLERIYDPEEGRILTGGHDLRDYGIRDWRKRIAYVSQDTPLLSGTIREAIAYGIDRPVTDEEVLEAARLAHVDEFIRSCPEGLSYEVGQFGTRLSGGQRQKLSVARAILSGAELLLLDEPTASLDLVSTDEILRTVAELRGTRTIVMVTHDGKALESADVIVVVDADHTVQSGSREELSRSSAFLRKMTAGESDRGCSE